MRFIFHGYLKHHHHQQWEDLVRDRDFFLWGPQWGNFDKTRRMYQFRTQSEEDLEDPTIPRMRKISLSLTNVWVGLVLGVLVVFPLLSIIANRLGSDIHIEFFPPQERSHEMK